MTSLLLWIPFTRTRGRVWSGVNELGGSYGVVGCRDCSDGNDHRSFDDGDKSNDSDGDGRCDIDKNNDAGRITIQ